MPSTDPMPSAAILPTRLSHRTALSDMAYYVIAWLAGGIGMLIPLAIFAYLLWYGIGSITPEFLFSGPTGGSLDGKGGIWPAIAGSLALVGYGLLPALLLGIGGGIYLAEFNRSQTLEHVARFCIESLVAVPGLVYSLFGYALLVVALKLKTSLIAGAATLGIVMLPQILISTHEALRAIDPLVRETAHALGVSHSYIFFRVLWPIAWPSILTSIVLSAVHALGSAAPLLFTAATVFTTEQVGFFKPVMSLPTHLFYVTAEIGAVPYAYGSALVLVTLVLSISVFTLIFKRRHHA